MKKIKYGIILGLLVFLLSCGKDSSTASTPTKDENSPRSIEDFERKYLVIMNEYRANLGLGKLRPNPVIADVALSHSTAMGLKRRAFGHTGFGTRCKEARARLDLDQGSLCGEIVAFGQQTPEAVFEAWYNSPDHRHAMEEPDFTHTGIGYFVNNQGRPYWTQMFMRLGKASF